jgi:plastocyanin
MGRFWTSAAVNPSAPAIEGATEVTVIGTEFGFTPEVITVTQGEPVNVTFVNDGRILHDFTISELDIGVQAGPGQEATFGFTPKEAGVYSIVCTLPGHASQGMTASLVVKDDT